MCFWSAISYSDWGIIVSIAIALIAVIITLTRDFILPRVLYPRIVFSPGVDGEFLATDENEGSPVYYQWYRLKIVNQDRWRSIYAGNLYVKLYEIKRDGKPFQPFNPMKLTFVSWQENRDETSTRLRLGNIPSLVSYLSTHNTFVYREALARGEYDYLNLCTLVSQRSSADAGRLFPGLNFDRFVAGSPGQEFFRPGKFVYALSIHGENVKTKPFQVEISYTIDGKRPNIKLNVVSSGHRKRKERKK